MKLNNAEGEANRVYQLGPQGTWDENKRWRHLWGGVD